ncbi:MAG: chemotaxis protein CheC [Oscillospiraceae bacterium]|nr:chemotaxis protein CheC [Oscillospiraceae bacterium]
MAINNMEQLNATHFDILKELGNIGQGNAASSLSNMLGKPIDIAVPDVRLLDFGETVEFLGGPENIAIGMLIGLSGDINGMMLYVLQKSFANNMLQAVMGKQVEELTDLDEMDFSFVQEIGNILAGSYINAIASLTNLTIDISVPSISVDMVGAILSVPAVEFAKVSDKVLFIDDSFLIADGEIKSNMILVPELESLSVLFSKLGVDI